MSMRSHLRVLAPTLTLALMLGCSSETERAPGPPACVGVGCTGGGTTVGGGGGNDGGGGGTDGASETSGDAITEVGTEVGREAGTETGGDSGRDVADFLDVGSFD